MSDYAAGDMPTAGQLNDHSPRIVYKSADQSVTSSTVQINDTHLLATVAANTTYAFDCTIFYLGAQAGDITVGWTYPTSASITWGGIGAHSGYTAAASGTEWLAIVADATSPSSTTEFGAHGTVPFIAHLSGMLTVGATAGTLQFQWAQRVSSGTATTVYAKSWLRIQKAI